MSDDWGPMPVTRYRGIDKPNPTLDEVLPREAIKRLQDAFADLRFPTTRGRL
ncbi:hydrolase [Mycobacterium phage Noelle]|uniref:Hydrolase n=1 Tax=Mycobacterium phage Noelle TaxID=2572317 RepID=A0A6B9LED8_9CAUD|nr:hydrolase [Mycobacterium phage Noelle]QHB38108.1 hydrolase [Mycobacterium phage Noelle]